MIKKRTVHQHLVETHGFTFLKQVYRHRFYSRTEDNGDTLEVSLYRTTLLATHVHVIRRNAEGKRVHSQFASLTNNASLSVIDSAIRREESLAA